MMRRYNVFNSSRAIFELFPTASPVYNTYCTKVAYNDNMTMRKGYRGSSGVGGVPVPTTGEKAWHSAYSVGSIHTSSIPAFFTIVFITLPPASQFPSNLVSCYYTSSQSRIIFDN
jgi:hypothetical protein